MTADRLYFVLYVNGVFLFALAGVMLVPMAVDFGYGSPDSVTFLASALFISVVAGFLFVTFRRPHSHGFDRRTGYLITASSWIFASVFGAIPFVFSSRHIGFTDAMFETVSGLTTSGATVLQGLDSFPPGLLLWRSLLNWIGGVGIIVMALSMLPALGVGGMQLFQSESSDISGKTFPKVKQLAQAIGAVYVSLTAANIVLLVIAGMPLFDAVNTAMATIATGGFAIKDASIGYYNSVPIEVVTIVFMIAGALPLAFYAKFLMQRGRAHLIDDQIGAFLKIWALMVGLATAWNISQGMIPAHALRVSAFNVTSIITDTGFATDDFSKWGSFGIGIFFVLYFIGGCAGSTAGSIKIFRWQLLFSGSLRHLRLLLSPNRTIVLTYQQKPVGDGTLGAVRNFFFMYLVTFLVLSLACMATGLDFLSSTSAVAQGMANAGPGLGPIVGPASNFGGIAPLAKWVVMLAMVLGRLELATLYVVLLPEFWAR